MVEKSGDGRFDNSLKTIFDEPMPGAPPFPAVPAAGSVELSLSFGAVREAPGAATLRFAAVQTPVEMVPGTLRVNNPPGTRRRPSATVKYDVSASGRVVPGSVEVLRTSSEALSQAIENGLRSARFVAPTSNCRAVSQTVVQTFGN